MWRNQFAAVNVDGDLRGEIVFGFHDGVRAWLPGGIGAGGGQRTAEQGATSSVAMGWLDRRTPMPPLAVEQGARNIVARRQYQGQRPRPEVRHEFFRQRGNFCHQRIEHRPIGDEHGQWVVGIAAFEVKDVFDGGKIQRIGAETVKCFGGGKR